MGNRQQSQEASPSPFPHEVLTTTELAERLKVQESWVVDQSKLSRTADPTPVFRLGKDRRYLWGSPQLDRFSFYCVAADMSRARFIDHCFPDAFGLQNHFHGFADRTVAGEGFRRVVGGLFDFGHRVPDCNG